MTLIFCPAAQANGVFSPEQLRCALVQARGQVQRASGEGSQEGLGGFGAKPSQVQQGSGEGPGEALVQSQVRFNRVPEKVPEKVPGGFGAEPGQVQQGSGECFGEGLGGFGAEPGEGSGEGLGGFGAKPGQVQQGSGWEASVQSSGSTGFRRRFRRSLGFGAQPSQVQQDLRPFNSRKPS